MKVVSFNVNGIRARFHQLEALVNSQNPDIICFQETKVHIFFALNAFRLMIPGSLLFLIVLYRSKVENYFAFTIFFLMISTFAYVLYQIYGGNPLENIDNLAQQATIQKLIVLVNILCVFIISFAFSNQYKILNQIKGL